MIEKISNAAKLFFGSLFGRTPQVRYECRHELLKRIAYRCGLRMHNRHMAWFRDPEYLAQIRLYQEYDSDIIPERRLNLYYLAKATALLDGDTAECGVFRGEGSFLIMRATAKPGRVHHVFDSFEGLSEPDQRDKVHLARTFKWQKHDLSIPEEIVKKNLQDHGAFALHKGWIPAGFADVKDRKFSFVHIDVDLFQPTYDSIAFFYERMARGGMILCDDYGSEACPGAYDAFNQFVADKVETVIHLTGGQGLVIKSCGQPA